MAEPDEHFLQWFKEATGVDYESDNKRHHGLFVAFTVGIEAGIQQAVERFVVALRTEFEQK